MMQQTLYVLQGPPASGKSTWARKFQEEHKDECVIVSRDAIRHARGVYWVPTQEVVISEIEEYEIHTWLSNGYSVIIDATNLNPIILKHWEDVAQKHDVRYVAETFYVPIEEAIERDSRPDREHHVGKQTILNFYEKYFPDEYDKYMMKANY